MFFFDYFLKRLLVSECSVTKEIDRLDARLDLRGQSKGDEVWDYMNVIDAKASAMLGHISIFAAVAGILLSTTESEPKIRIVLSIEFTALLFLTFLCLRCIRIIASSAVDTKDEENPVDKAVLREGVREMLYRRRIYVFVHETTGVVTLAMIATALFKFIG